MTNEQHCTNCGMERGKWGDCKHDNIERILKSEQEEPCPFWFPKYLEGRNAKKNKKNS